MLNRSFIINTNSIDKSYFDIINSIFPDFVNEKLSMIKSSNAYKSSTGAWALLAYALLSLNITDSIKNIKFTKNKYGKIDFENIPFHFNISHSGCLALVSISEGLIGCDIEQIKEPNYRIIDRFFAKDEISYINRIDNEILKKQMFYRYWTMKESYLKCLGTGLTGSLDSFSVIMNNQIGDIIKINDYYIKEYIVNGYSCTICSEISSFFERLEYIECEKLLEVF